MLYLSIKNILIFYEGGGMKRAMIHYFLTFLLMTTVTNVLIGGKGEWYDRPLGQSTEQGQQSTGKKNTPKKKTAWYKKPHIKYAAGALVTAAGAAYAWQQCLKAVPVVPAVPKVTD